MSTKVVDVPTYLRKRSAGMETIEVKVAFVEHDIVAITYTAPNDLLWKQPGLLQGNSYNCDKRDVGAADMLQSLIHRGDIEAVELFSEQPLENNRTSCTMHIVFAAGIDTDAAQRKVRVLALVELMGFSSIDSMLEKYQLSTTVEKPEKLQSAGSKQRRVRDAVSDAMATNAMDPDKCAAVWQGA